MDEARNDTRDEARNDTVLEDTTAEGPARPALVLTVMCAGMFLVLLDVTVVNVALPSVAHALRAGPDAAQWIVDAYAVAVAALLLAGGAVGDRIGHRRVVLLGLAVFGVASAGCGFAPSGAVLVAARAVQGVGAALLLPGSLAVITEAYPGRAARARALGIWAGVSSLALPAGPLLGGVLVTVGGWRSVFLVNLPVVAGALVLTLAVVPRGVRRSGRRPDLPGMAWAAVALGAAVFAVIDLGHHGPRPAGLVALVLALVSVAGLVGHERRSPAPMLPPEVFRRSGFVGPNVAAGLMNMVSNGALFVTTLYLQNVQRLSPLAAGLALLPLFVPLAVLGPPAGRLTARFGPRPPLLAGALCGAAGAALFAALRPDSHLLLVAALLGLGVGAGLFTAPIVTAAVSAAPAGRSGLGSGVNNAARQTGTALGVAVFGTLAAAAAPGEFMAGLHVVGVLGAALWVLALVVTAATVGRDADSSAGR
jgi:DHA2 family methylenomycin A resistance protein-like MFS transporter